jgi:hypothetical protein
VTTAGLMRRGRAVLDALGGVVLLVPTVVAAPLLRRAFNRWGTTRDEARARLPGEALIRNPRLTHTRAISIDVSPEQVWPWLVQLGQGRGGLFSYDVLENLIGCRIHSVEEIVPELQHLAVGDLVRLGPERYPAFRVIELEPIDFVMERRMLLGIKHRAERAQDAAARR